MKSAKTKTLFATLAAATAVAALAAPAAAQSYGRHDDRYEQDRHGDGRNERGRYEQDRTSFDRREAIAIRRIDQGAHSGQLNRAETFHLREIVRGLSNLEDRYSRNGLNRSEWAELDRRYDRLEEQIGRERRDREYSSGYRR